MAQVEKENLWEVLKDGEELLLFDGRRLWVNPGDMPTCITWLPTEELELSEPSGDRMFPVKVRNLTSNAVIRAAWM